MMGGVDTVMPDKIVKRVVNEVLIKAGLKPVNDDIEFIKKAEETALVCGYRPVEFCWITWLIQPERKNHKNGKNTQTYSQKSKIKHYKPYKTEDGKQSSKQTDKT
jgi:hypothetical protein